MLNILPLCIIFLAERDRAIYPTKLIEEGATGQPHPVCGIHKIVGIDEIFLENVSPFLPMLIQVASSQKTSHAMSGQMMHPPLNIGLFVKFIPDYGIVYIFAINT